jgi:hypothetical protein
MPLVIGTFKEAMKNSLSTAFQQLSEEASQEGSETTFTIDKVTEKLAEVICTEVDKYLKTADVLVGPTNVAGSVTTAPGQVLIVTGAPAKLT